MVNEGSKTGNEGWDDSLNAGVQGPLLYIFALYQSMSFVISLSQASKVLHGIRV